MTRNKKRLDFLFSLKAKWVFIFLVLFFILSLFLSLDSVLAQPPMNQGLAQFTNETNLPATPLPIIIGRIVRWFLGFLGLIAVIIIIYAGFLWMTSRGDQDKIDKAKKMLRAGLIGLFIIVISYAAALFIINLIVGLIGPGGPGGPGCQIGQINGCYRCVGPAPGRWVYDSGLPGCTLPPDAFKVNQIVTTHGRGEYHQDVYLCSAVQPIFNHWLKRDKAQQLVQENKIKIVDEQNQPFPGSWNIGTNAMIFKHPQSLFATNSNYRAFLSKEIEDVAGKILERCLASGTCSYDQPSNSYIWPFTTGETTDNVAPMIINTYPTFKQSDPSYPDRNVSRKPLVQVGFSEPIDFTTIVDENNQLIASNIWVAEIDGQGGDIVRQIPAADWQVEVTEKGFQIVLRDDLLLNPFVWYRIHVGNVADLCANIMDPNNVEWEFQTNDRGPGVSSYFPTGERACPDTNIAVVFNTQMYTNRVKLEVLKGANVILSGEMVPEQVGRPYSMNGLGGRFFVEDNNDNPVNNHFRVFKFDPTNNLESNTQYRVKVTTDLVINQQGDKLEQEWTFKTATPETCLCAPWISWLSPSFGPRGQCLTAHGECFKGTVHQPAVPKNNKAQFIFNNSPIDSDVGSYDDNYFTTIVPTIDPVTDYRPDLQITIQYSPPNQEELTSNQVEYFIDREDVANGPCLWSIYPASGRAGKTKVTLNGQRFGSGNGQQDKVIFYNNRQVVDCPDQDPLGDGCTWTDGKISNTMVPSGAESGEVFVQNNRGTSNSIHFEVIPDSGGAGEPCYWDNVCLNGPRQCQNPNTYFCLVDQTDCRCCCRPNPNSCQNGLQCMANQGRCTGSNRGLCCGCQSDDQCGTGLGCGILDPNRCCYAPPIIELRSPEPDQIDICRNGAIQVLFNQLMDKGSLSPTNIKFERCSNQQCSGNDNELINFDLEINEYTDKTGFTLYPRGCLLQPQSWHRVTVTGKLPGGRSGDGVRSEKGVSMIGQDQWVFKTGDQMCIIDRVELAPNEEKNIFVDQTLKYSALAFSNNHPVCVLGFDWASSNPAVASVSPLFGRNTTATGLSQGSTLISGGIWVDIVRGKITERRFIQDEEILNVKPLPLRVEDSINCNPSQQQYPSPNPRPNYQQACQNIKVSAKFNKNLNPTTLNTNTFIIFKEGTQKVIARSITVASDQKTAIFEPTTNLDPNTSYTVILKSGSTGIKGSDNSEMESDYTWTFKTMTEAVCPIAAVGVDPATTTIIRTIGGTQNYLASALGENCQRLTGDFTWAWSTTDDEDPPVATISPTGPGDTTTATANHWGETDVVAQTNNKSNSSHLIVAPPPTITSRSPLPNSQNVCRNALISARFDQELDKGTINLSTVILWEKDLPIQPPPPGGRGTNRLWEFFQNIVWQIKNIFFDRASAAIPGGRIGWTRVDGQVVSSVEGNTTLVTFIPNTALVSQRLYEIEIKGSQNGIKNKYGTPMINDNLWQFTTGNDICQIDRINIDPTSFMFTRSGQRERFIATALARDDQAIQPISGVYTWTWQWSASPTGLFTVTGNQNNPSTGTVVAGSKNGSAILKAEATDSNNRQISATAAIEIFICENLWSYPTLGISNFYNFQLSYCRDGNPLLVALNNPVNVSVPPNGDLKLHWLFNVPGQSDVVGLMIYDNFDHLTPLEWYKLKVNNPGNSASAITIDGYQALRDGRTVYIGAANADFGQGMGRRIEPYLYSNIFVLSYNNNASPETLKIIDKLIWQFNTNIRGEKDKLIRDLQRIYHFNEISSLLEKYKQDPNNISHLYPELKSGSYITGMTTSRWDSWQENLATELKVSLPIDPTNKFLNTTCQNINPPPPTYQCCAGCPKEDKQCGGTCYNPAPSQQKYECLLGSNVYQYVYRYDNLNKVSGYNLYSKLEYYRPNLWQQNCASYSSSDLCDRHHWCLWTGGACRAKDLDYSGSPCPSPSSCACFNMRYTPTDFYQRVGQHQ